MKTNLKTTILRLLPAIMLAAVLSSCDSSSQANLSALSLSETDSDSLTFTADSIPCTIHALNYGWTEHVLLEGMEPTTPDDYILLDIDNDNNPELLLRGDSHAVFTLVGGRLTHIAHCWGEYEQLAITADGFVCKTTTSGRDADEVEKQYFHLKNSQLDFSMTMKVSRSDPDDDSSELVTTYTLVDHKGNKMGVSPEEADDYMPSMPEAAINDLDGWQPISENKK